jgi:LPXTG-motif cell wall-anchored protein
MSGSRLESALVPSRRRIAAVLAVVAVASAPSAALAQSGGAGDDQYVDPIGGNTQKQGGGGSNSNGTSTGPTLSSTPSLSASSSQPAPAAPVEQTLPRTGFDAGALAAIGLALLLTGLALRRRLADEHH